MIQSAIFTKLQSRLDEIADNLAQELDPVVEEAANMVADKAKDRVPTETGRLQEPGEAVTEAHPEVVLRSGDGAVCLTCGYVHVFMGDRHEWV